MTYQLSSGQGVAARLHEPLVLSHLYFFLDARTGKPIISGLSSKASPSLVVEIEEYASSTSCPGYTAPCSCLVYHQSEALDSIFLGASFIADFMAVAVKLETNSWLCCGGIYTTFREHTIIISKTPPAER